MLWQRAVGHGLHKQAIDQARVEGQILFLLVHLRGCTLYPFIVAPTSKSKNRCSLSFVKHDITALLSVNAVTWTTLIVIGMGRYKTFSTPALLDAAPGNS